MLQKTDAGPGAVLVLPHGTAADPAGVFEDVTTPDRVKGLRQQRAKQPRRRDRFPTGRIIRDAWSGLPAFQGQRH